MIESIIFDFDGVLVESLDIKTEAFGRLFEKEGSEIVQQVVRHHVQNMGKSRLDKFRYIYSHILKRNLSDEEFRGLCERFSSLVLEQVVAAPYVEGAWEFLSFHSRAYQCFVASATPQDEIETIVGKRRMSSFFRGVFGAPTKKNEIVKSLLDARKISSATTVFVGDAWVDYETAQENGLYFIARLSHTNQNIFDRIECPKVQDFRNLQNEISRLSAVQAS